MDFTRIFVMYKNRPEINHGYSCIFRDPKLSAFKCCCPFCANVFYVVDSICMPIKCAINICNRAKHYGLLDCLKANNLKKEQWDLILESNIKYSTKIAIMVSSFADIHFGKEQETKPACHCIWYSLAR